MQTQIKQMAARLRGLRESLDLTSQQAAEKCEISESDYLRYEEGASDIPVSFIVRAAQIFGVETAALFSGQEPHNVPFFVTRRGTGAAFERTSCYKYQALAAGFPQAKAEPFEVTVEPDLTDVHHNSHPGQEFNMVLEGTLELHIGTHQLILNEGDSVYFNATLPHGMKALNGNRVRFLAIIL